MVVKVEAALGAVERGVGRVIFADGRIANPIRAALERAGNDCATHNGHGVPNRHSVIRGEQAFQK